MKMKRQHRLGVDEVNLVRRHLKVIVADDAVMSRAVQEIDKIYGMDEVSFDSDRRKLHVSYDASRICLDCIEEVLDRHYVKIDQSWWNRFKEEHYRFVDQNIKDNATHIPFSCHKVPPHK